jgi:uncharacterized protein
MEVANELSFRKVELGSGFWAQRQALVSEAVIPYQWKALNDEIPGAEPSHAIENLRIAAGLSSGEFHGFQFQDSDVAKWIEAASFSLVARPDPALERLVEGAIDLIGQAQEPDGYIQSYYRVAAPGKRWSDLEWGHELYCGGHLIEAAVAHHLATGSRKFLDIMLRYVDCVDSAFGPGEGKRRGYDGHPEIELALFKLYRITRDERHLRLAEYFVDERGRSPSYFDEERKRLGAGARDRHLELDYFQAQAPLREQHTAEGHAVRAMYLYSAAADYCREKDDARLLGALKELWDSVVERRMYVTGGIGSQAYAERFSIDYDLPPDRAYAETCASIGLVLWAWRMLLVDPDSRYADVLERALYNGVLSGMSADGTRFFYVNPLEARPALSRFRRDLEHVKTRRVEWFGCACCPPNIARLIASIGGYVYSSDSSSIWVHTYMAGQAILPAAAGELRVSQATEYPWEGRVLLTIESGADHRALRLRIPEWSASSFSASVNGEALAAPRVERGYLVLERDWKAGDRVELELDMRPRFVYAAPELAEAAGRVAVQRGPLVLCAEGADNGSGLSRYLVDAGERPTARRVAVPGLGESLRVELSARRAVSDGGKELYRSEAPRYEDCRLVLLPYFQWANRGEGEMSVWLRVSTPNRTST